MRDVETTLKRHEIHIDDLYELLNKLEERIAVLEVKVQQLQWQINQIQYKH